MPRTQIPVVDVVRDGAAPSPVFADATNDHYVNANRGDIFLEIISNDGGPQTVVVETPIQTDGLDVDDLVIDVPAGGTVLSGAYKRGTFNQDSSGTIYVNPSVSSTLTIRAFRFTAAG